MSPVAIETEIKLTLGEGVQQTLEARAEGLGAGERREQELHNRYFDTPEGLLARQGVALRVREASGTWVQTLKGAGAAAEGFHRRQEWEWPLAGPELDLRLLGETPVADLADPDQLEPLFETNFRRISYRLETFGEPLELALDLGEVQAAGRCRPICEMELESKGAGEAGPLMRASHALMEGLAGFINPVSKAQQGYWLAGQGPGQPSAPKAGQTGLTTWLRAIGEAWLTGSRPALSRALALLDSLVPLDGHPGFVSDRTELARRWQAELAAESDQLAPLPPEFFLDPVLLRVQLALLMERP